MLYVARILIKFQPWKNCTGVQDGKSYGKIITLMFLNFFDGFIWTKKIGVGLQKLGHSYIEFWRSIRFAFAFDALFLETPRREVQLQGALFE